MANLLSTTITGNLTVDTNVLYVDSTNNRVGIGITSPTTKLYIQETAASPTLLTLHNYQSDITPGNGNFIEFLMTDDNATATPQVKIGMVVASEDGQDSGIATEGDGNFVIMTMDAIDSSGTGTPAERVRVTHTGKVGIGTSSPSEKLHVTGTILSDQDEARIRFNSTSGTGRAYDMIGGNDGKFYFYDRTATSFRYVIDSSGNVGIGTTSPAAKLDVYNGNSRFWHGGTSYYTQFDNNNEINTYTSAGVISTMYLNYKVGGDVNIARGAIVAKSAGNVGIGTTSPTGKLSVVGDGTEYSNIVLRHSTNQEHLIYASTNVQYNLIGSSTPTWIWGQQSASERMRLNNTGLGIGTTSPSQKLHVVGNTVTTGVAYTDIVQTWLGTSIDFRHQDASVVMRVDTANARVGIGITSPAYKLDVNGSSGFRGDMYNFNANTFWYNGTTYLQITNSSDIGIIQMTDWTKPISLQSTGGNVGIGTTSPSHKLHVNGGNIFGSSNVLASNNVYAAGPQGFVFGSSTSEGEYIYRSGNDIRIHANSGDRLTVLGTGNVGIGTTSPGYKLHVVGASSGYIARVQGSSTLSVYDPGGSGEIGLGSGSGQKLKLYANDTLNTGITIDTSGNVGIGTSSPSTVFHVDTSSLISPTRISDFYYDYFIGYGTSVGTTKNNNYWQVYRNASQTYYANSSGGHYFGSGGNDLLRIQSNGNVLIGTTTDAGYKLDVNGTTRIKNKIIIDAINDNYSSEFLYSSNGDGYIKIAIAGDQPRITTSNRLQFSTNISINTGYNLTLGSNVGIITYNNISLLKYDEIDWTQGTRTGALTLGSARYNTIGTVSMLGTAAPSVSAFSVTYPSRWVGPTYTRFIGTLLNQEVSAASNNNTLIGLLVKPTYNVSTFTGTTKIALGIDTTEGYGIYQYSSSVINYFNGDVGIGTSTPSTKLDVNGVITATGGNSTNWNTSYGWGNHASVGYLTSSSLTGYATETYVNTAVANLVDSAPGTLDTLNELAAALGDDPNFATTVTNSIAAKQAQLNGTGFVKVSGTTVSYDNSTYLTSYTETDTFATVTNRGATATTNITVQKAYPAFFLDHVGSGTQYGGPSLILKNNLVTGAPADTTLASVALTNSGGSLYSAIRFRKGTTNAHIDLVANNFDTTDLRVATSGNVLVGTTTDNGKKFQVNGDASINGINLGRGPSNSITNTVLGYTAYESNVNGTYNTAIGRDALWGNTTGDGNTALGAYALGGSESTNNNTGIGQSALGSLWQAGDDNTAVGNAALGWGYDMQRCTAVGAYALVQNDADYNTALGYYAGFSNVSGTGNLFLGYQAGQNETGSNKLYISNSSTSNLIYGDFSTKYLGFGTTSPGAYMHIKYSSSSIAGLLIENDGVGYNAGSLTLRSGTSGGMNMSVTSGGGMYWYSLSNSSNALSLTSSNNLIINGAIDNGKKLQVNGDVFIKGSTSASSTKIFEVQNSNGTSIMDFRGDAYAFFGCGQGGGAASGFIFRYNDTAHVQFTGYNYGNGAGSYKPILLDTDLVGRGQGIYVNFGGTGYANPAPLSTTEFAVRGRTSDATQNVMELRDSNNTEKFVVKNDGAIVTNGNMGWSGTVSFPSNPPGQQNLEFTNGILTNVF